MTGSAPGGGGARQYATFHLGGLLFGVEVNRVREVLRYQPMRRVPLAPDEVAGLLNLRGQVVVAVDLRRRLGLPDLEPGARPKNLVIDAREGPVSLLVDRIGDVIEVLERDFEHPPVALDAGASGVVRGVYRLDGGLLHVLRTEGVLSPCVSVGS